MWLWAVKGLLIVAGCLILFGALYLSDGAVLNLLIRWSGTAGFFWGNHYKVVLCYLTGRLIRNKPGLRVDGPAGQVVGLVSKLGVI